MQKTLMLCLMLLVGSPTLSSANDIDRPSPLIARQQEDIRNYQHLQTQEIGQTSIAYGALIGLGADVVYNFMTSQVLSRLGWRWLSAHCTDCRPVSLLQTFRRIAEDAPGFVGLGATFGACDASGFLALSICRGGIDSALNYVIQTALGAIDRDLRPSPHFADQVAGHSLMSILWHPLIPRGIVVFGGTSTETLVGNGIVEIFGEGIRTGLNTAIVNTASRALHREPLEIRQSFMRGLLSGSIEHLLAVATLGPRIQFSERDEQRILRYTLARSGLDNAEAFRNTDFRLSHNSVFGGSDYAQTFMNQVLMYRTSINAGESEFLITAAHEVTHVRQMGARGFVGMYSSVIRPSARVNPRLTDPYERVPSVISNDCYQDGDCARP